MRFLAFAMFGLTGAVPAADFRGFLEAHCLECHDSEMKKGDLDLSHFTDEAAVMRDRSIWRSVFEKIESRQMPPPKQKSQPTEAQRHEFMTWIMDIAARPDVELGVADPGNPVLRRLTRLEYNNTVRDLFELPMDVFMFPERLPIRDKSYFQPANGQMPAELKIEMREYGAKYPVLCPQLGLPGDNRAEHGYRNRGDAQDFSPLLLEKYLAAALEIVNAPELPHRSRVFAELVGMKQEMQSPADVSSNAPALAPVHSPDIERAAKAEGSPDYLEPFREHVTSAHADGLGGVFDVPRALANQTIAGKGGLIRAAFGARTLTINPDSDLWLASFATTKPASAPAILTNKLKGAKTFELTFDIVSEDDDEGIERLGVCVMGRQKQSGMVKLTAVFTDGTDVAITAFIAEGAAGTTFYSFAAPPGEAIKKLAVDGSQFSGDYVLLDDLGIITNGKPQVRPAVAEVQKPAPGGSNEANLPRPPRDRLAAFMPRAFRREVADEELAPIFSIFQNAQKSGRSEADAMRTAIAAVLSSPGFLYIEANGDATDGKVSPLEDHELATRLALFLWSSTPDDELLRLAMAGKLREPAVLEAQTRRMLKDRRARELSESFAVQWLRLDQLHTSKPDRDLFPGFYAGPQGKATMHGTVLAEALLLFETVQVEDRGILDFLAADYTWLNAPLARLYGLQLGGDDQAPEVAASTNRELKTKNDKAALWHRVKLSDANRGGFMTMAAPLVVTSLPFRTSPVKRGAWLLETLFNRPPTEPKVAFAIENDTKEAAQQMSIREKFEAHRNKAACYSCHIRLDPPGFALERFNPVGQWDEKADAKGEWSGSAFDGPAGFKSILARHPHEFTRGFIEHLLSYALGRKLEVYDMPVVDHIQRAAAADGWKFSRIIVEIVRSYSFTHVRRS
jgi:hypothetical protein